MNKIYYDIEFGHLIKNYIIPKIDEFQRLLEYLRDKFEYFDFKEKVIISDMIDSIYTELNCNYDDCLYFSGKCIKLLKEDEEENALLDNTTYKVSSVDDYDIDEEEKYHREDKVLDDDELYCNKIMNNGSSSICSQSFEIDEVF